MSRLEAHAKINLALVVGPLREDGKHEVVTLLQRIDLHDTISLEPSDELAVDGFAEDALVRAALTALGEHAGVEPAWRVTIEKSIPVASGLGGGSADAAAALLLANRELAEPLPLEVLHWVASGIGADVPFFLREGTQLAAGDGTDLKRLDLPLTYHVVLVLPAGETKASTGEAYRAFDERAGERGFDERRSALLDALAHIREPVDLTRLPQNDLASSPVADRLVELGAFRADVSGAGPTVYGLFDDEDTATQARDALASIGRTWLSRPVRD
jgi:4-diphosphocytidyl-2-C-methyl-D-erythritol kinase